MTANQNPTPEQISKLPKWAQSYINNLEKKVQSSNELLDGMGNYEEGARFYFQKNVGGKRQTFWIPADTSVFVAKEDNSNEEDPWEIMRFTPEAGSEVSVWVEGAYATTSARSSNHIHVGVEDIR